MYTSIQIGKAINKAVLHRKFCSDLYAENLVDLRAMILHLGGHFKYVFDRATGELWPKSYVCKQLRKGVSAGQWLAMAAETNLGLSLFAHPDIKYIPTWSNLPDVEGAVKSWEDLSPNGKVDVAAFKGVQYLKRGYIPAAGTGVGIATYRALKLLEGPALRQIQKKQEADEKKMRKGSKKRKTLPDHESINDLRRQLYKKRGFKPIWFIQPNGKARGIEQIHLAYSIYS